MACFKVIYYVYMCEVRGGVRKGRLQQATGLLESKERPLLNFK